MPTEFHYCTKHPVSLRMLTNFADRITSMAALENVSKALQQGDNVSAALRDLNILLEANDTPAYVQNVLTKVPLVLVFGYLRSENSEQTRLACSALEKLLSRMPAPELLKVSTYIELGLQYKDPTIKRACLTSLDRNADNVAVVITAPTMFHLITQVLADDSLECATLASKILLKFLTQPALLSTPVKEALVIDLSGIMKVSSTVRYRVYELGMKAIVNGDSAVFELISSSGLLDNLLRELEVDDILAQLNCVELLLMLLESEEGSHFLEGQEVTGKLYSLLVKAQQDPFGAAIIPGLIKFFGHVAVSTTDVTSLIQQYPLFLSLVYDCLPSPHDTTMWGISLDTFALLGSKVNCRGALLEQAANTEKSLRAIGGFIANGSSEVRTRSLHAVAQIISCPEANVEESVSQKWFKMLGPKIFSNLMSIVKQPFAELRHSGLKVLLAMAGSEWGQREMNTYGGFLEYLLDRHTETDKEGRELKYEIVHVMALSPCAESVWGSADLLKLKKYDREGPFYQHVDSAVATEGSV